MDREVDPSPRALNFWVNQRADKALEYFTKRTNTVSERANAVDLPALVNGEEVASSGAALHNLMQHVPLILLITGPGGTGKTTLACQLGGRAIGEDGGAPLAGHKVLYQSRVDLTHGGYPKLTNFDSMG